jgi:hypothetical protein
MTITQKNKKGKPPPVPIAAGRDSEQMFRTSPSVFSAFKKPGDNNLLANTPSPQNLTTVTNFQSYVNQLNNGGGGTPQNIMAS